MWFLTSSFTDKVPEGIPKLICNTTECGPKMSIPDHLVYVSLSRDDYNRAVLNAPRLYD